MIKNTTPIIDHNTIINEARDTYLKCREERYNLDVSRDKLRAIAVLETATPGQIAEWRTAEMGLVTLAKREEEYERLLELAKSDAVAKRDIEQMSEKERLVELEFTSSLIRRILEKNIESYDITYCEGVEYNRCYSLNTELDRLQGLIKSLQ